MADLRDQLQSTLGTAYSVERELGGGGMSRVFVATETALGRTVVVKVLPPETSGGVSAERFKREVQLAARLQHPCIVPLLAAGEAGDLLYYTMPLVSGDSLRARLASAGELPVADAVRVLRDVAAALSYAHRQGVVHRDLKPDNVLLSGGYALVTDFGVAKALSAAATSSGSVTSTSVVVGTPLYMAPEQAAADPAVDHRADIYALGVLAYEMLAGRTPFGGRSPHQVLAAQATEVPEPIARRRAHVPEPLGALVMRCLEKSPEHRPQSAEEVLGELEGFATPSGGAMRAYAAGATGVAATGPHRLRRRALAIAGAAVVLGVVGYSAWARTDGGRGASDPRGAISVAATDAPKSVAVLPFANVSGDTASEYFSDGITDELIGALSRVGGLRVAARSSVFALKGKGLDARTVGDTLDVATVLEGSVRRAGNRFRVQVQLVGAEESDVLWSESYDRELTDVFAVQEEIARAIVSALRVRLSGDTTTPLVARRTADLAAHDLYLQGRFLWSQRTGEALAKAVTFFERAIERDRRYAAAYAGLAETYVVLPLYAAYPPSEAYPKATAAAESALALDSTLAGARAALGQIRVVARDWAGAEAEFQRAIRLNPRDASAQSTARGWYAGLLGRVLRRDEEAMRELHLAVELDPLSRTNRTDLAVLLYFQRRYDEAAAELRRALELDPSFAAAHQLLGRIYLRQGRHAEAVDELERSVGIAQRQIARATLAYGYAATGHRPRAVAILDDFTRRSADGYVSPFAIALAHTGLGQTDSAFAWLERAAAIHDPYLAINYRDPLLDPIRSDPRFARLLARLGVPP